MMSAHRPDRIHSHPTVQLAAWLIGATALLFALGPGSLTALELFAAHGALSMLFVPRGLTGRAVGIAGVAAIGLGCAFDASRPPVPRALIDGLVFSIGVLLAARARAAIESEEVIERVPASTAGMAEADRFAWRLAQEIGRARRHGRTVALLSVAPASGPGAAPATSERLFEIVGVLGRELRLDSALDVEAGRALAVVPDIDPNAFEFFLKRIETALEQEIVSGFRLGVACFPKDAVAAERLIELADLAREAATR